MDDRVVVVALFIAAAFIIVVLLLPSAKEDVTASIPTSAPVAGMKAR